MEESRDLFLKYMNDIRSCTAGDGYPKILSFKDEQEIAYRIKSSIEIIDNDKDYFQFRILDKRTFEKNIDILIKHNLLYVAREAKIFHTYNMVPLLDLIQEGNIGLYQAAVRFDPSKGYKFITYARGWIRQSMFSFISEKSRTVALPIHIINNLNKIRKVTQKAFAAHGYVDPLIVQFGSSFSYRDETGAVHTIQLSDVEIKGTELHPTEVLAIQKSSARGSSLSDPLSDQDEADTLEDILVFEGDEALKEHRKEISDKITLALNRLAPRDKEVMESIYGINKEYPMDIDDVAEKLNCTTVTINCIRRRCLIEMKMFIDKYDGIIDNVDVIMSRWEKRRNEQKHSQLSK